MWPCESTNWHNRERQIFRTKSPNTNGKWQTKINEFRVHYIISVTASTSYVPTNNSIVFVHKGEEKVASHVFTSKSRAVILSRILCNLHPPGLLDLVVLVMRSSFIIPKTILFRFCFRFCFDICFKNSDPFY